MRTRHRKKSICVLIAFSFLALRCGSPSLMLDASLSYRLQKNAETLAEIHLLSAPYNYWHEQSPIFTSLVTSSQEPTAVFFHFTQQHSSWLIITDSKHDEYAGTSPFYGEYQWNQFDTLIKEHPMQYHLPILDSLEYPEHWGSGFVPAEDAAGYPALLIVNAMSHTFPVYDIAFMTDYTDTPYQGFDFSVHRFLEEADFNDMLSNDPGFNPPLSSLEEPRYMGTAYKNIANGEGTIFLIFQAKAAINELDYLIEAQLNYTYNFSSHDTSLATEPFIVISRLPVPENLSDYRLHGFYERNIELQHSYISLFNTKTETFETFMWEHDESRDFTDSNTPPEILQDKSSNKIHGRILHIFSDGNVLLIDDKTKSWIFYNPLTKNTQSYAPGNTSFVSESEVDGSDQIVLSYTAQHNSRKLDTGDVVDLYSTVYRIARAKFYELVGFH